MRFRLRIRRHLRWKRWARVGSSGRARERGSGDLKMKKQFGVGRGYGQVMARQRPGFLPTPTFRPSPPEYRYRYRTTTRNKLSLPKSCVVFAWRALVGWGGARICLMGRAWLAVLCSSYVNAVRGVVQTTLSCRTKGLLFFFFVFQGKNVEVDVILFVFLIFFFHGEARCS